MRMPTPLRHELFRNKVLTSHDWRGVSDSEQSIRLRQCAIPPSAEADIGGEFGSTTTRVPRVTRL